ncbi:MAG: CDGSH iron-sulfur domain-containing protein [Planctomycetes bacterium]|nr:CDGSH iron-sulfur domain-containing protein [Planctomycetota bacterium]MCB9906045.1 CDGSH iron-sulfur domain-containing protein [Planctomycetota bacterium]
MEEPQIAATSPAAVEVEGGKNYAWCACGRSAGGALCDGSHAGSAFRPQIFKPEASGTVHLCRCKRTKTPPYCDGTHSGLA